MPAHTENVLLDRRIRLGQSVCVLSALGLCMLLFAPLYRMTGSGVWQALLGIPVMIAAQFWGQWRGLLVAGICAVVGTLLHVVVAAVEWPAIMRIFLLSNAFLLPIGAIIGRLHDIRTQLRLEIEERARTEHALRTSKCWYRELFNHMSSGVAVYEALDEHGSEFLLKDLNTSGERISRVCKQRVIGKTASQVFPGIKTCGLFEVLQRVFLTGIPEEVPVKLYEDARLSQWVENSIYKLPTGEIVAVYTDVTQQKRTQNTLRQSEELFRTLIESQGEGSGIVDADENFTFANPEAEKIFGVPSGTLVGRNLHEFFDVEQFTRIEDETQKRQSGARSVYELQLLRPDGGLRDLLVTATPRFDRSGIFSGTFGIFRDITDRKQADRKRRQLEIQLRQSQKLEAIGELAGGIAHDFNNILGSMMGYTELLLRRSAADGKEREFLEYIYRSGERAAELVKQILLFSRSQEHVLVPTNIAAILEDSLNLLRATIPATIVIRRRIQPECPPILADTVQIQQVIVNLCVNAAHAMRVHGGTLDVVLEVVVQSSVQLTIRDNGCGMPQHVQEHLFEPFFTTKGPNEGSGLGLSVVHGIVTGHHGTITVESAPDRGSAFTLLFPATSEPVEQADAAPHTPEPGEKRGKNGHLLIADDEVYLTKLYDVALAKLGYRVTLAKNGAEALRIFRADPRQFDLLVTDQMMPGMSGTELSEELLKLRPDLPIIVVTGYREARFESQAKALGIHTILMKPLSLLKLVEAVQKSLNA